MDATPSPGCESEDEAATTPTSTDLTSYWGVADDGDVIEVAVDPSAADALIDRWPPIGLARLHNLVEPVARRVVVRPSAGDGEPVVSVDGQPSWGGWERVESELALFAAERLSGLVAVHAAVIVSNGKAVIVPGASGAGKSTLCVAAAAVGAQVLTDEYALIDPTSGLAIGWRRPVRVRQPDGSVERRDLAVESGPVPIGLVALVRHGGDATRSWAPVSGTEAVLGLLANTVCAQSRSDEAFDAALAVSQSASAIAGTREDADSAILGLLDLLADQ